MELMNQQNQSIAISDMINDAMVYMEENSQAANTTKAYTSDWNHFVNWCQLYKFQFLPSSPDTVTLYMKSLVNDGYKPSTIQRRVSSISTAHQTAGHLTPTKHILVRKMWSSIKNNKGIAQLAKTAAKLDDVRLMVNTLKNTKLGTRDRALLLIGFSGAFRRSELVNLNVEDIEIVKEGLTITIRKSKTDQDAKGQKVGIPYGSHLETCPVRAYKEWLEVSGIATGAIFMSMDKAGKLLNRLSDKGVAIVVKRSAKAAGLDPVMYAGHSLRSGFATTAAAKGVSERSIMKQTRHKSVLTVRRYIQDGGLFLENAAAEIGL